MGSLAWTQEVPNRHQRAGAGLVRGWQKLQGSSGFLNTACLEAACTPPRNRIKRQFLEHLSIYLNGYLVLGAASWVEAGSGPGLMADHHL